MWPDGRPAGRETRITTTRLEKRSEQEKFSEYSERRKKNRGTLPPVEIDCPFTKKSYLIKKNTYIYIKREKKKIVRPPAVSNLIFIFQGGGNKRITRPPNGDDVLPPKDQGLYGPCGGGVGEFSYYKADQVSNLEPKIK